MIGHVAFVESVNADGTITVSEYNENGTGSGDTRTGTPSSLNLTEFVDFGVHPNIPLVGDVNGDGKADAVLVNPSNGNVWTALSTGSGFGAPVAWSSNALMANATKYFLADVNGDGKADLVAYFANGGNWYAALSDGTGFRQPTSWAQHEGDGNSSADQFLADVNGDGKADVVTWNSTTGNWYVDLSSGSGFYGPPAQWISGHGVGSSTQLVGDFNGDGKADAAVYFASNGDWYVGLSTGSAFGYPNQWSQGHGLGSSQQLAGDSNGDHLTDISYFTSGSGNWSVGTSSGSGFWTPTSWAQNEGGAGTTQFLADVNGDGKADVVTYWEAAGATPAGTWSVDESSGTGYYGPPNQWINGFGDNYR